MTPTSPVGTPNQRPRSALQLLRNRQFSWLVAGNTMMFFGFGASILLRSLLAWRLTGDAMSLAYINLVAAGCMTLTSAVSGALVDRVERRKILLLIHGLTVLIEGGVLVLLMTGHLTFPLLLTSAFLSGFSFPFIMPARTAMMVTTVGRAGVAKANAVMSGTGNLARMASPALVGFLSEFSGLAAAYALLFAVQVLSFVATIPLNRNYPEGSSGQAFVQDIAEGFSYIGRHKPLLAAVLFGLLPIMTVMPLQSLMVIFVDEVWQRGDDALGIMMAAMGVGGVLGSVLMSHLSEGGLVKPLTISTILMALMMLVFSHTPSYAVAVVAVVGIYCASVLGQTILHTAVQLMADEHMRGRITTMTLMSVSAAPLGTFPLAYATKHLGAPWAMTIAAVILIIFVIATWYLSPSYRRMDEASRVH